MNLMCFVRSGLFLSIAICVLAAGCAPTRKTGTVTDGIVKGIAVSTDGSLGQLDVELTVKLDDGKEIKAAHMVEQEQAKSMKGKRVDVEPGKGSDVWKVVRVLN